MTASKGYYMEGDRPVHRLSYCAFLDVLGFSDSIEASYKDGVQDDLLYRFHAVFKRHLDKIKHDSSDSFLYFKSFSDNVLLAHPSYSWTWSRSSGLSCGVCRSINWVWR